MVLVDHSRIVDRTIISLANSAIDPPVRRSQDQCASLVYIVDLQASLCVPLTGLLSTIQYILITKGSRSCAQLEGRKLLTRSRFLVNSQTIRRSQKYPWYTAQATVPVGEERRTFRIVDYLLSRGIAWCQHHLCDFEGGVHVKQCVDHL